MMLNGGYLVDCSLALSGGIHNQYYIEIVKHVTQNTAVVLPQAKYLIQKYQFDKISANVITPNVEELFQILLIGYQRRCLIGCTQNNVIKFNKRGE
jgi:hypothetical protein